MSKPEVQARRTAFFFLLRFSLISVCLSRPWPGWNQFYAGYFRTFAQAVYHDDDQQIVRFEANPKAAATGLDTQLTLTNRALLDAEGKGRGERTEIDTRSVGWLPTALTLSLIAATPIPWRRRGISLLGGLILVHAFIWISLQAWVWAHATKVSLLALSGFWQGVADEPRLRVA